MEWLLWLLESLHTKRVIFAGLALGTFFLSVMFSYRAAVVYYDVFRPLSGDTLAWLFAIVVFLGIAVGEMVSALHWVNGKEKRNFLIIVIVVLHDGGGVFYTLFGLGGFVWDPVRVVVFVSMSVISVLPFLFGYRMHQIAPEIQTEIEDMHTDWVGRFGFRMEHRGAKVIEKETRRNPELLKRFAPSSILRTLAEAKGETGPVNAVQLQPGRITAYPARTEISEEPVQLGSGFPVGGDYGNIEAEEDTIAPFQPRSNGKR